jgi:hypothetical protein
LNKEVNATEKRRNIKKVFDDLNPSCRRHTQGRMRIDFYFVVCVIIHSSQCDSERFISFEIKRGRGNLFGCYLEIFGEEGRKFRDIKIGWK